MCSICGSGLARDSGGAVDLADRVAFIASKPAPAGQVSLIQSGGCQSKLQGIGQVTHRRLPAGFHCIVTLFEPIKDFQPVHAGN